MPQPSSWVGSPARFPAVVGLLHEAGQDRPQPGEAQAHRSSQRDEDVVAAIRPARVTAPVESERLSHKALGAVPLDGATRAPADAQAEAVAGEAIGAALDAQRSDGAAELRGVDGLELAGMGEPGLSREVEPLGHEPR